MALLFTPLAKRIFFPGVAGRITAVKKNKKGKDAQAGGLVNAIRESVWVAIQRYWRVKRQDHSAPVDRMGAPAQALTRGPPTAQRVQLRAAGLSSAGTWRDWRHHVDFLSFFCSKNVLFFFSRGGCSLTFPLEYTQHRSLFWRK